jgi:hypothetical protein
MEEAKIVASSIPDDTASTTTDAYRAGDVVCTTYGVGVIVQHIQKKQPKKSMQDEKNDDVDAAAVVEFFAVRLWRTPGKSMSSSALAMLQPSTVCIE